MLTLDWNLLWTFVNLIILTLLMKKFLFKPVLAIMEKRTKSITNSLDHAQSMTNEAMDLKNQYEAALSNAKSESASIVNNAKQRAKDEYEIIVKNALTDATRIKENANKAIEIDKEKAMRDMQGQIASLALIAASKLVEKNMDEDVNKQLVDEFLMEAGVGK